MKKPSGRAVVVRAGREREGPRADLQRADLLGDEAEAIRPAERFSGVPKTWPAIVMLPIFEIDAGRFAVPR